MDAAPVPRSPGFSCEECVGPNAPHCGAVLVLVGGQVGGCRLGLQYRWTGDGVAAMRRWPTEEYRGSQVSSRTWWHERSVPPRSHRMADDGLVVKVDREKKAPKAPL